MFESISAEEVNPLKIASASDVERRLVARNTRVSHCDLDFVRLQKSRARAR
jgi:hypothetical protein